MLEDESGTIVEDAAQQTGNNEPTDGPDGSTLDAGEQEVVEKVVPIESYQAEKTKRQNLESEVGSLRAQMAAMQSNMPQNVQTPSQQKNLIMQVAEQLGYGDEEYWSPTEQAEIISTVLTMQTAQIQNETFIANTPDYEKVVGSANPLTGQFVPSEALTKAIQTNPMLTRAIMTNPPNVRLAYQVAKPFYVASSPEETEKAMEKALSKSVQKSISNAPGAGSTDKLNKLENMSDEQFARYKAKIKGEG